MKEYFVSFYGCILVKTMNDDPSKETIQGKLSELGGYGSGDAEIDCACADCPNPCGQRELFYRCHLGNLTEEELEYFKQSIDVFKCIAFAPSTDTEGHFLSLHSLNDISLDSIEERREHFQARMTFENCPDWNFQKQIINIMWRLQHIAEEIREMRQESRLIPSAADIKNINILYRIEKKILREVTRDKVRAVRQKKARLEAMLEKLETKESRLKTNLEKSLQDLQEYELPAESESDTTAEQIDVVDCTLASTDIDIADLLDPTQWQLVSVDNFLNPYINRAPTRPFSSRELEEDRQNGKITWLDESQGIGRDANGRYLQRTGKNKHNFRYHYFLRCEFYKESNE